MRSILLACLPVLAALGPPASDAEAGSGAPDLQEAAQFGVLPGWRTDSGTHMTALRVTLGPGWKTYWRAPGDAGIPPRFDWEKSENLQAVEFHWPTPEVFHLNGMQTIGYRDELILPIELTPRDGGEIALRADLEIGVCQDICMPMHVRLRADLPPSVRQDPRIRGALADTPASAREAGVRDVRCSVAPISDGLRVSAEIEMPRMNGEEVAVFEMPDQSIWVSEADVTRDGGTLSAVADMVPPNGKPFMLNRSDVRITIIGAGQAVDIRGCAAR